MKLEPQNDPLHLLLDKFACIVEEKIETAIQKFKAESPKKEWLTLEEAQQLLRCSKATVWARARKEMSIRTKRLSARKELFNYSDCEKRLYDANYRPFL